MKINITADEAISLLPEGDDVHTFRNPGGMLLGADRSRSSIEAAIRATDVIQITGSAAQAMGHGIAINEGERPLFIATDREKMAAFDRTESPA